MLSKRTRFIVFAALVLLSCQVVCKGPYRYESYPVIWVNTDTLTFSASVVGSNPAPQILQIKNSGIENLTYTLSDNADWLSISPTHGTSTGQVNEHTVSVDKSSLPSSPDAYTGVITVESIQAPNSPQQVTVLLNLSEQPPPEISVTPSNVNFSAAAGGSNPPAQTIQVRNSGQGTLNYTLTEDAGWLNVNPTSGTSTGNEVAHSLAVDIAGLPTGTYTTDVTIADSNASNSPQSVSVTLTIGTTVAPAIDVSPGSLTFSGTAGGANPATQRIRIRNSGGGTLDYAVTSDVPWTSVTPPSGTSTGQDVSHTVSVNIAGLAMGTYNGLITVSSPNASNSPRAVPVTLVVGAVPTNNQISISCVPSSGGTGSTIEVWISILGNTSEIKAFGLDVAYDKTMFNFVGISKGTITGSWAFVTGSETGSGARIGGIAGDPSLAVPVGSSGIIAILVLQVSCGACADGLQSQLCMSNFTDDIVGMTMAPGCVTFTFRQ